ncbi:fimbrial protein [Citrobacter farmeri]|uniref:fimbrial protein n=1 Tax=Citrobacter farmeri TaxID=67824 RepID=UPI003890698D|nr:type 1 fimbrial protein [Citrobacter farmeri]
MSTTFIQYGKRINRRSILFVLMLFAFAWPCPPASATANVYGGNGFWFNGRALCVMGSDRSAFGSDSYIKGNACPVPMGDVYVPKSGSYFIRFYVMREDTPSIRDYADSTSFYLDATKPLNSQVDSISITTHDKTLDKSRFGGYIVYCDVLVDTAGKEYSLTPDGSVCADAPPLPPIPTPPDTSCSINNSKDLAVHFGTIERADLSTEPGVGNTAKKSYQIPVTCTGGIDVAVKMHLANYDVLTINNTDIIQTTTSGLGVAVIYNDKVLTTKNVSLTLKTGLNTIVLDFQAVRDPTVAVETVNSGYFTANAVLVMTQQ